MLLHYHRTTKSNASQWNCSIRIVYGVGVTVHFTNDTVVPTTYLRIQWAYKTKSPYVFANPSSWNTLLNDFRPWPMSTLHVRLDACFHIHATPFANATKAFSFETSEYRARVIDDLIPGSSSLFRNSSVIKIDSGRNTCRRHFIPARRVTTHICSPVQSCL